MDQPACFGSTCLWKNLIRARMLDLFCCWKIKNFCFSAKCCCMLLLLGCWTDFESPNIFLYLFFLLLSDKKLSVLTKKSKIEQIECAASSRNRKSVISKFGSDSGRGWSIEIRLECRCLQKCFLIWNYYVGCLWAPLLVLMQSKETVSWSNLVFF
jgi:hypothetical protein